MKEGELTENSLKPIYVADTWRRVLAYLVDQMLAAIFFIPIFLQISSSWMQSHAVQVSLSWLIVCGIFEFLYHVAFLRFLGATVGKLLFGLRVVDFHSRGNLSWMQCLLRVLCDHLSIFLGASLKVVALVRFDRRHVSDWVAETQVTQNHERSSLARPHWILASIFFVYFSASGVLSAYRLIQRTEYKAAMLILHPVEDQESGLDAGSD